MKIEDTFSTYIYIVCIIPGNANERKRNSCRKKIDHVFHIQVNKLSKVVDRRCSFVVVFLSSFDDNMTLELFPNEIFLDCFEYLNALEIFQAFDRLNQRFSRLIRSIPLHVNFQHVRRNRFEQFCRTIQSDRQIQQQIYSLHLSNEDTCGQMELFLSKFSLEKFRALRSLVLIRIEQESIDIVKELLAKMHRLHSIHFSQVDGCTMGANPLLTILPMSNLRMLKIPTLAQIETVSIITHLSINECSLDQLTYWLLKCTPRLKSLAIDNLYQVNSQWRYDTFDYRPAVHLKQLTIKNLRYSFEEFTDLIKLIPNLISLAICTLDIPCMINADGWEYLIKSFLPNLQRFQFIFGLYCHEKIRPEMQEKFQRFERHFWSKEHRWLIEYIFDTHSAVIYTVPYLLDTYRLDVSMKRYSTNQLKEKSRTFDNVRDLIVCDEVMREACSEYFPHITSLKLTIFRRSDQTRILPMKYFQSLKVMMSFYYLKHVDISSYTIIEEPSFLVEFCQAASHLSSMTINPSLLPVLLQDRSLCDYLNQKIRTMNIYKVGQNSFQHSMETEQFCELFPDLDELICVVDQSDQLLTLLSRLSKLSTMTVFLTSSNDLEGLLVWFKSKALELQITYRITCFYTYPGGPDGLYKAEVRIWTRGESTI